jgi:hypothetical protein
MRDSNVANVTKKSAQADFSHGLQGLSYMLGVLLVTLKYL